MSGEEVVRTQRDYSVLLRALLLIIILTHRNLFQSEKVLQMSYANYQGKDALVDKFRNSAVLNERPEWRPQLFHSSGLNRGQPHPFPAPNSAIRRERSAQLKSTGMFNHAPRMHASAAFPSPGNYAPSDSTAH